jgi:hypothetical protein
MAGNLFPEAEADPSSLHIGFLASTPKNPDLKKLESLKAESERFHLSDHMFYLQAPEGVGRSRLAASAEKALGVPMIDRKLPNLHIHCLPPCFSVSPKNRVNLPMT